MKLLIFLLYALTVSVVMARRGFWSPRTARIKSSGRRIQRVLIVGATGGTGRELVTQALERGYEVTAFVRDPAKLKIAHSRLKLAQGDVCDATSVEAAEQN